MVFKLQRGLIDIPCYHLACKNFSDAFYYALSNMLRITW